MGSTIVPERWERILDIIDTQGLATVEQIAEATNVSASTVRRDLAGINERGLIRRTRGGAMPQSHIRTGATLAESRKSNPSEKEIIGRAAAALVHDDDTLLFDGGFTTYQVARQLQAKQLTIISNSLDVIQVMAGREGVTLIVIGGELSVVTGTNLGPKTAEEIGQFWADKAILGADAVSPTNGLSSPNLLTAQTKKAMIEASRELIIVADHTKLGRFSPYRVADCGSIRTLVTDDKADPEILQAFRNLGVEVLVAAA